MPRHVRIRPTVHDDAGALQALVAAVARERRYLGTVDGFTLQQTLDHIARVAALGGVQLIAIDIAVVGWVDITPGPYEGLRHCGRLGMGVAAEARGRGVGAALLARALDEGFRTLQRIELEVFASNARARALYARLGFVEEGRRRCARKLAGTCDDILICGLLRDEWRPVTHRTPPQRPAPSSLTAG